MLRKVSSTTLWLAIFAIMVAVQAYSTFGQGVTGTWKTGSVGSIQYQNQVTGATKSGRGHIFTYKFLANGTYEAFGASGAMFLGEISVDDQAKQQITLEFKIPFAYGSVKLPDREPCKNMVAFIKLVKSDGREYGPYRNDAFRDNPKLKERGMVFVPLLDYGSTFKLRFAAMTGGRPPATACSIARTRSPRPSPVLAETGTTRHPSRVASSATSNDSPCFRAASIRLSATTVGRPSSSTCPARNKLRSRLVASATHTIASGGAALGSFPSSASQAMRSSGVTASRL